MLKIKQKKGREWGRLFLKAVMISVALYLVFGVMFGVSRGVGENDGDLIIYCRVCREYKEGDAMMMGDGLIGEYGKASGEFVLGKVVAKVEVRGF